MVTRQVTFSAISATAASVIRRSPAIPPSEVVLGDVVVAWLLLRGAEVALAALDAGATVTIETPPFEEDLALRLVATDRN